MSTSFRFATALASLFAFSAFCPMAFSQANGTTVVVLDVGKVFKEHTRFNEQMEVMKKDIESFEAYLRAEQEKIQKMAEELRTFKSGSSEYNTREADIAKYTSNIQVETQLKRKEFMQKEAKLFYNTYTEITNHVRAKAREWNVHLVLRYNSQEIKPDDRASVMAAVNANVIYQADRDITSHIIQAVNEGSISQGRRNGAPQIPRR